MYELIKKQIAADYFQQRFPNDGQRFVAWYLRNILFRDMNETRDDITDGGDDKQIDAIVIDDDKALVQIIQGDSFRAARSMPNHCAKYCRHGFRPKTLRGFRSWRIQKCSASSLSWPPHWMMTTTCRLS